MSLNHGKKKKKVIFFGDSINDLDILPGGYISWIINHQKNEGVEDRYNMVSSIKPGDKIYDLYLKLEDNVLAKDAKVAVLYVGVNDVCDKYLKGTGTDAQTFESLYHSIIHKLQAADIKVIVCTPAKPLNAGFTDDMKHELAEYAAIIRNVADQNDVRLADLEKAFDLSLEDGNGYAELNGNKLIADEIWRVLKDLR